MKPLAKYETIEVPIITKEEVITLSLPIAHAQAVLDALNQVGGSAVRSRRGLIDEVKQSLWDTNRLTQFKTFPYRPADLEGAIPLYFKDSK